MYNKYKGMHFSNFTAYTEQFSLKKEMPKITAHKKHTEKNCEKAKTKNF